MNEIDWSSPPESDAEIDWSSSPAENSLLENHGWEGVFEDISNTPEQAYESLLNFIEKLPQESLGVAKQVSSDWPRTVKNVSAGLAKGGHGTLSALGNIRDYLAKKGIISEETPSFRLPENILPKEYNYAKGVGLENEKPGDFLLQGIAGIAPYLPLGEAGAFTGLGRTAARTGLQAGYAAGQNENPLAAALTVGAAELPFKSAKYYQESPKLQASNIYTAISNKRTGNKIIERFKNESERFGKEYEDFFAKANKADTHKIENVVSGKDLAKIKKGAGASKYAERLEELKQNPTIENLHYAGSDLGKLIRKLEKAPPHETSGVHKKAIDAAKKTRENIKHEIARVLSKNKELELAEKYKDLQNRYRKEYVPYLNNKSIRRASISPGEEGYIFPERLPDALSKSGGDPFMAALLHKHPELAVNRFIKEGPIQDIIKGGLGLTGLPYIFRSLAK